MNEILIGVAVGTAVAILAQLIAYVFDIIKRKAEERRKSKAVIKMMLQELMSHQALYEHHLAWANESIARGGEGHTGYSYQPVRTSAYETVFLPNWHVLPDKVVHAVAEYYSTIEPLNILSGSFSSPTPVPIVEVKKLLENARAKAGELQSILQGNAKNSASR